MAQMQVDADWVAAYPVFALGTAVSLGFIETDILPFIDLGMVLLESSGIELTLGRLMSAVALLAVYFNRDAAIIDQFGIIETWIVYATLGLIIAPPFFPLLSDTIAGGLAGVVVFIIQSIGFTIVTLLN